MMKRTLMAASVISMLAGGPALAQTVGVGPCETVIVEPEQRTLIREYVVKEKVPAVRTTERISVGQPLPLDVELRPVPPAWGPRFTNIGTFIRVNTCTWSSPLIAPSCR